MGLHSFAGGFILNVELQTGNQMKYIDVFKAEGDLDGRKIFKEFMEKFLPDIVGAFRKTGRELEVMEVASWINNLFSLLPHAASACYKKHKRIPDKIRMILKISSANKVYIFFVPYSLSDELEVPARECPLAIIGGSPEDYEILQKIYPNTNLSIFGAPQIKNN